MMRVTMLISGGGGNSGCGGDWMYQLEEADIETNYAATVDDDPRWP
jgi:hypothetical protein